MIKNYFLAIIIIATTTMGWSQCITITPVNDTTMVADSMSCTQVFNYTINAVDTCPSLNYVLVTDTFNFTGAVQYFTVPFGVDTLTIDMYGGDGYGDLGYGGYVHAKIPATAGELLYVYVGGAGTMTTGGFNGGGNAGSNSTYGAGGGASDIRISPYSLFDRIVVAGGGGGSGSNCGTWTAEGGDGGGLIGGSGCVYSCSNCQYTGSGGTQISGGIAGPTAHGSCGGNTDGSFGQGGSNTGSFGTGGGGGFYGGGSGCFEGAGGGSSYTYPLATDVIHTQGVRVGDGLVVISYMMPVFSNIDTFFYTGTVQNFTVPANVSNLTVEVVGASGGTGTPSTHRGGYGGKVIGEITVNSGDIFEIYVGGAGNTGSTSSYALGGYNGGGNGGFFPGNWGGGGGGGASDIRITPFGLNNRIIVAGGGGGGGYNYSTTDYDRGGNGGGTTGETGFGAGVIGGQGSGAGGTQLTGGLGGTFSGYCTASDGILGVGGLAGTCSSAGGGGGGGYYGGGGATWSGGGGGSSYTDPIFTNVIHEQGANTSGNGWVVLRYNINSTITLTQTAGLPSGSSFPVGTTNNVWVASDGMGNGDTLSFTVTVTDVYDPSINCPTNVTTCNPIVNSITPTAIDLCSGTPTIVYNLTGATTDSGNNDASGETFNTGVTNVTYTATDASGNSAGCTFSVTVVDCSGIEEMESLDNMNVYPNPTNGVMNIALGKTYAQLEISLVQLSGKEIRKFEVKNTDLITMDVNEIAAGVYMLIVKTESTTRTIRVIKQ